MKYDEIIDSTDTAFMRIPLVRGVVLVDGHDYYSFAVVEALMEAFFNASEARSARLLSPDSRGVVSVPMTRPFQLCVQPR